ncbi:hypothetical protein L3Q82_001205 [Scortum barcoo]|uniref:Uncharacterized protein n=1 Tax=Scortum barcoo TaxID=214431 RepID=A0ACB8W824_9TELE|nr:hypothetical protein L3Q82_001205 [Scortum barcoo]
MVVDEIHLEYLKSLDVRVDVGLSWLTCLCSIAWRSGTVPLEWQTGVMVPLFKKGDRRVCSNYRVIALLSLPWKVYARDLQHVLERFAAECEAAGMRISTSKSEAMVHDRKRVACPLRGGWALSLRDRVRSSVTWEELGVEPLLLRIKRSQLRWLGYLFRMPPGRLPREVFQACPTGRRPRGRPRTRWRDYVCWLAWERLGVPPEELEEVSGVRHTVASSTGAPQGTVLSPVLFTLYTSDFQYKSEFCHVQKFADDTAIVGCIRSGQEDEYRELIKDFVTWCDSNHLLLNTTKTREMVVDFRRPRPHPEPVIIKGTVWRWYTPTNTWECSWMINWTGLPTQTALCRKGQSRLYFLRRLASFNICNICKKLLQIFYQSVVASALLYAVVCWGGSLKKKDAARLDKLGL